jgi:hypothetical protein
MALEQRSAAVQSRRSYEAGGEFLEALAEDLLSAVAGNNRMVV